MNPFDPRATHQVHTVNREQQDKRTLRNLFSEFTASDTRDVETMLWNAVLENRQVQTAQPVSTHQATKAPADLHLTFTAPEGDHQLRLESGTLGRLLLQRSGRTVVLDVRLAASAPESTQARTAYFEQRERPSEVPPILRDALVLIFSSGITTALYQLLRAWVDKKNGRKIRCKFGDTELDVSQMSEEEFLKLYALLREWHDNERARGALIGGSISLKHP